MEIPENKESKRRNRVLRVFYGTGINCSSGLKK
jgi:hypothetical protein